ncbi:MAG TPA: hypothetical protein VI408_06695 [Gaiellaceae bacterium]
MLECIECGARTSDFEQGWAAVRIEDPDRPGGRTEVAVYCGRCFAREFEAPSVREAGTDPRI